MTTNPDANDPILDRLADAAIAGDASADESLALTAAAAALALGAARPAGPMPGSLRARLEADADRHFSPPVSAVVPPPRSGRAWRVAACVGWLAAAASWLLMATSSRPLKDRPANVKLTGWTGALKASDHPLARDARGEVLWDPSSQAGLLRLQGLAGVDPGKGVYQLWIFDSSRDTRYPVDGGTFTVPDASSLTVVPVRARLPVARPTLFAITLEPPGGVVVSDRQRVMLTASYP